MEEGSYKRRVGGRFPWVGPGGGLAALGAGGTDGQRESIYVRIR